MLALVNAMEVKPEELLVEAWIPTYKRQIRILHSQLVQIRSMLFILDHIARFPFDLFCEHRGPFWYLVRQSLETSVVVGLWRILLDTDDKALTTGVPIIPYASSMRLL